MPSVDDILGPGGRIDRALDAYEPRSEQLAMARAVYQAMVGPGHLVVEAGTGVGKSFAYLVPAILAVVGGQPSSGGQTGAKPQNGNRGDRRRVVISTHTISLQEQLMSKDLPFLRKVLDIDFSAVLVKGRSNYMSLRRLNNAVERGGHLFSSPKEMEQLRDLARWSKETQGGSLSDLDYRPLPQVWDEVASDSGNCMGRKCPTHARCFYFRARRSVQKADILVVNHALLFSDLALRQAGTSILPDYDVLIFDEAHTAEQVAADHLGLGITSGQIDYVLNRLYNNRTNKGLLAAAHFGNVQQQVQRCRELAVDFFRDLEGWLESHAKDNGRIREPEPVEDRLTPELKRLAKGVDKVAGTVKEESQKQDYLSAAERLHSLSAELEYWRKQTIAEAVYWIERVASGGRRGRPRMKLAAAPVDVGPALKRILYDEVPSVIFTSATLAVGRGASFDFFTSRMGLDGTKTLRLGSPFDYRRQAQLVLVRDMPDPSADARRYERLTAAMVRRYVAKSDGHAFALFTSYSMMRAVADQLRDWLSERNLAIYCQSDGMPRHQMIERFKENPRALLLGTVSFWQGVDVPGEALTNVIITKLPFSVPGQPLLEARLEKIREKGGNPFMQYQVPEAIIRLRQGFGRLIRTQQDRGMEVILDPRVRTKRYGKLFLDSLPSCRLIEESANEPRPGGG